MSQRDDYEPGVPCWVDTLQPDPEAAMAFYGALFGWEFARTGPMGYSVARLRGRDVAGDRRRCRPRPGAAAGWITYVYVESADETAERVRSAGGAVLVEAFDVRPAGRMAVLADPGRRGVRRMGARRAQGRAARQRARRVGDEPPRDARSRRARPRSTARCSAGRPRRSAKGAARSPCSACPATSAASPSSPSRARWSRRWRPCATTARPRWTVNFWDHDVDATAARAVELGGRALRGALRHADDQDGRARRPARRRVHHQQRPRLRRKLRWPTSPSSTT